MMMMVITMMVMISTTSMMMMMMAMMMMMMTMMMMMAMMMMMMMMMMVMVPTDIYGGRKELLAHPYPLLACWSAAAATQWKKILIYQQLLRLSKKILHSRACHHEAIFSKSLSCVFFASFLCTHRHCPKIFQELVPKVTLRGFCGLVCIEK